MAFLSPIAVFFCNFFLVSVITQCRFREPYSGVFKPYSDVLKPYSGVFLQIFFSKCDHPIPGSGSPIVAFLSPIVAFLSPIVTVRTRFCNEP